MNDLTIIPEGSGALTAVEVSGQVQLIQQVMRSVMKADTHYGIVPGTDKPTLFKAGAEKLCATFRLGPEYDIADKEREADHLTITARCTLFHIPTGRRVGSALGSCSTHESKYAYRNAGRACPTCGAETIIKGKPEYGGGWLCFAKKGGCGAKFPDGDAAIASQIPGRVETEDKADQYNTVLKMACKRALLAAVLNATAASDIFAQDLAPDPEDRFDGDIEEPPRPEKRKPAEKAIDPGAKVTLTQVRILRNKCNSLGIGERHICETFGIGALEELPASKFNDASKAVDDASASG